MDIAYLMTLLQNKLNYLSNARASAAAVGDLNGVTSIDQEFLTTQNTLAQLQLLQQISSAALAAKVTPADLVATAVSTTSETPTAVQGPSASAIINGYDISAYATDPLYEQKIKTIIAGLPTFSDAEQLTAYMQGRAPGSPLTGDMIMVAVKRYAVDLPLMVAIMQNDSQFGTQGVAVSTNNPGNVGNTGYATRSYPSWDEGVEAVAIWLDAHRVAPIVAPEVAPKPAPAPEELPSVVQETATSSPATTTPIDASSPGPSDPATTTPETLIPTPPEATTTPSSDVVATSTESAP